MVDDELRIKEFFMEGLDLSGSMIKIEKLVLYLKKDLMVFDEQLIIHPTVMESFHTDGLLSQNERISTSSA